MAFSAFVALFSLTLAAVLRSRAIYVIAAICWVQNLVLPWWYTQGWTDEAGTRALIMLKDVMLLLVFVSVAWRGRWAWRWRIPAPMVWILVYGAWALFRTVLGLAMGEPLLGNLRVVRGMLFPVEVVVSTFLIGMLAPRMPRRYERFVIVGLTVCAVVSLFLYFLPSDTFWFNEINIASYNVEVKGDPTWTVLGDLGVPGSGVGRRAFQGLSAFRLFGTFGDPLTAGMAIGLALIAVGARRKLTMPLLAVALVLAAALFLTFSRSAWILAGVGVSYLAILQGRPWRVAVVFTTAVTLWVAVPALRQFAVASVAAFTVQTGDLYHVEGITNFYSLQMLRPVYLIGTGPISDARINWVYENGYAYLMVQYGLPLLVLFVGFCFSTERYLRRHSARSDLLARIGAASALATVIVANFSFYALGFTSYFAIWSLVGLGIGVLHRRELQTALDETVQPLAAAAPSGV